MKQINGRCWRILLNIVSSLSEFPHAVGRRGRRQQRANFNEAEVVPEMLFTHRLDSVLEKKQPRLLVKAVALFDCEGEVEAPRQV